MVVNFIYLGTAEPYGGAYPHPVPHDLTISRLTIFLVVSSIDSEKTHLLN